MREFTVQAPAKLNLFLDVINKRPDGYHNIETIFEKIDLKDEISIKETKALSGISVKAMPAVCPSGEGNIVYKALKALMLEAKADIGLDVIINKKIPAAAGLGGGSSDAAAALMAVNKGFGLGVSHDRICAIASGIGKDIPFFLGDKTFAAGIGAGEMIEEIDSDWELFHVILKPKMPKSTAAMYSKVDSMGAVFGKGDFKKAISAVRSKDTDMLEEAYYNTFDHILNGQDSPVFAAKKILRDCGAGLGFLSGSGPSVFCIFEQREEAMGTFQRIPKTPDIEVFIAASYKI
jgi:4-diphosphocytidyl-2-C-methyl-D-erythritol kinase